MSTPASSRADTRPALKNRILARFPGVGLAVVLSLVIHAPSTAGSIGPAERADFILIVKHERKLYLLHDKYPLRSYRIALGLSPTGAKEHEWDFRTPEGSYIIDFRLEHSHYFKALHVS